MWFPLKNLDVDVNPFLDKKRKSILFIASLESMGLVSMWHLSLYLHLGGINATLLSSMLVSIIAEDSITR